MWIFGYGSLLWKTEFPYEQMLTGHVKGYVRRFWQKSPDHRGTEESPGRTVTLVPDTEGQVWGVAYRVPDEHKIGVRDYLNFREKAGYGTQWVTFFPDPQNGVIMDPFKLEVYISPPDGENQYFAGQESDEKIAETIATCVGPSGTNIEYLLKLVHAVKTMRPDINDEHLFRLEQLVLKLVEERKISDQCLSQLGYGGN